MILVDNQLGAALAAEEIIDYCETEGIRSIYYPINDARAAGLGELWQGKIATRGRFILLTLGTGLGAVFVQDGLIVTGRQVEGLPESGELWDYPYRDTYLENATGTTKAAVSIYRELGGTDSKILGGNLKKLASMGRENSEAGIAQETFAEFGRRLGEGLTPIVKLFHPKSIILSGNIALAYHWFESTVRDALKIRFEGFYETDLVQSDLIDRGGLLGAAFLALYPNHPYLAKTTSI